MSDDRRVMKTRRALRAALVSLLIERGWDAIHVQDLCERADVGRSTFYTHFADKEDLLLGGFDDLKAAIRQQVAADAGDGMFPFARGLIEHADEHRRLFRALVGKRSGQPVLSHFRDLVVALVREDLGRPDEAVTHFVAGGMMELLTWWLDAKTPAPPTEIERMFQAMAGAVVRASRR